MNEALLTGPAIDQFRDSQVLQESLRAAMAAPGFVQATKAIAESLLITEMPPPVPGLHPDSVVAREYMTVLGAQRVLSTLNAMAMTRGTHPLENLPVLPDAFSTTLPAEYADPRPPDKRSKV